MVLSISLQRQYGVAADKSKSNPCVQSDVNKGLSNHMAKEWYEGRWLVNQLRQADWSTTCAAVKAMLVVVPAHPGY